MKKQGTLIKYVGYFYVRNKKSKAHFLSAWLSAFENSSFGWEWGTDGTEDKVDVTLTLYGLKIIEFKRYRVGGFCLHLFGFWWMK